MLMAATAQLAAEHLPQCQMPHQLIASNVPIKTERGGRRGKLCFHFSHVSIAYLNVAINLQRLRKAERPMEDS